ncbi:response regulator receiver protein [Mucilaginibacter mali]|uniref:Response regulator receiver protein n=1 Tax=Mucilaginibacter mali TaxID=2740462 RepID=A0A7D4UD85_9SPHI|nr:response regulator receiver protein [Mucilaginibacter mali]QKJ32398.1 response regulator receiver protein [Mucilaginibacter mali]
MNKTEILAVCRHPEILQTIIRLINNNPEWNGTGATDEHQAMVLFTARPFDVVLMGSGMDAISADKIKPACRAINPLVKFIQHYGGGSGLLTAEIYGALTPPKPSPKHRA